LNVSRDNVILKL